MELPTKDISCIEYAPEFTEFSADAFTYCIQNGATKLRNVISTETIDNLARGLPLHQELLTRVAPEIQDYFNLFHKLPDDIRVSLEHKAPWSAQDSVLSHTDGRFAPWGVSLLVPLSGEPAFFGADEERFSALTEGFPAFMAMYGLRDAILLRQGVFNTDSGKHYGQIHHVGVCSSERTLLVIDVLQEEISSIRV